MIRPGLVILVAASVLSVSAQAQSVDAHDALATTDSLIALRVQNERLNAILDDFLTAERECPSHPESASYFVSEDSDGGVTIEGIGPRPSKPSKPVWGALVRDGHLFIVFEQLRRRALFEEAGGIIPVVYHPWCPEVESESDEELYLCLDFHYSVWTLRVEDGNLSVAGAHQACL